MNPEAYLQLAEVESSHWWYRGRRAILADVIAGLELPDDASIFEIGCGSGGNLGMLMEHGTVRAMELDDTARAIAETRYGDRVEIAPGACPDAIAFRGRRFDLICMFDVLEHVAEDRETLQVLRAHLAPGGRLLISVPAYQWLWGVHDDFLHHQRRYTAARLRKLAGATGYRVARLSYFNTLLFPLAAAARLKDRLLRPRHDSGHAIPPGAVNAAMAAIFGFERHLLARISLPFGVSLLTVLDAA